MIRALLSIALLAIATPAVAQSVEAETLFVEGEKQMAAGQYAAACEAFAASNRLEARAGTLINLGLCEEKRERYASAWIAFREALTRVKDPVKKQVATEHAAAVEARLSYLTIELPLASKVEGMVVLRDGQPVDAALFGRAIPVDGGAHTVSARAPGKAEWTRDVIIATERERSIVTIPVLGGETSAPVLPVASPVREHRTGNRHTGLTLAFGAVGLIGLGTGIVAGVLARGSDRDAAALCPDLDTPCTMAERANDLLDRRDRYAVVANVGYGLAAAGVIAAGISWFTGRVPSPANVAVVPTREGANITVRVTF